MNNSPPISNYDYVIVGSGSAGAVLANRLTEDRNVNVLVIEAGPVDHTWDWRIHMPTALSYPMQSERYNWAYWTTAQKNLNNRRMETPRGRVYGGSSSINGMAYVRGHALDYNRWATDPGLAQWDYANCLPYFRKANTRNQDSQGDDYHGGDGPQHVTTGACKNPLYKAWIKAGEQAGYPVTTDQNGYRQEGVGTMDMTVYKGRRWSTSRAYLRPAMKRANLTVHHKALALRIVFDGKRAVGVDYQHQGGVKRATVDREVIVSGGSINSPKLLMLSGIGPAAHLKEHDIAVVQDLPGVGENLQDHLELYVQQECSQPISLHRVLNPWGKLKVGLEWYLFKTGLGASNHFEAGGFIRSRAGVQHPDIQYHFLPAAMNYNGSGAAENDGFQAHVGPMRSQSRGTIRLASANPAERPIVDPNYMSHPEDWEEMRASVRLTREIFGQSAFDDLRGGEISPGKDVQTDAEIDAWVAQHTESAYHPSCSCKMGSDDMSVVDGDTKVHGIEGLRVVDSSIMPTIASGNLNAPTIMIGEKAADIIRGQSLPPSDAPFWVNPEWETRQR
ncbi:choline dehydrogenase [Thalassospira mesophila]|uniref:Choline dehydrogenase n=1 Tax=Thalassospira mesophila TaxID=1293891 RepID=A0A1Y2KZ76_9PROT|nr:choline dehydrogenase [Thalassospira mesophila]OSQ37997.1 choline dehydrogenase [Thalassospira mesophila]